MAGTDRLGDPAATFRDRLRHTGARARGLLPTETADLLWRAAAR